MLRALVTLCEKAKRVNLVDEIEHACPPSKSKSNYENPCHHKYVHYIQTSPPSNKSWRSLHSILKKKKKKESYLTSNDLLFFIVIQSLHIQRMCE